MAERRWDETWLCIDVRQELFFPEIEIDTELTIDIDQAGSVAN